MGREEGECAQESRAKPSLDGTKAITDCYRDVQGVQVDGSNMYSYHSIEGDAWVRKHLAMFVWGRETETPDKQTMVKVRYNGAQINSFNIKKRLKTIMAHWDLEKVRHVFSGLLLQLETQFLGMKLNTCVKENKVKAITRISREIKYASIKLPSGRKIFH